MPYRVFISHSTRDQGLVIALAHLLSEFEIDVFVAEWYLMPGQGLDQKVFGQIDSADCVVVLLTRNGRRSAWVQQEIGWALAKPKIVIPLVEKGTDPRDLGALQGKDYIEYDPQDYQSALTKASIYVKSLKLKKEEQKKALLVAGGIVAFLLLLSEGDK
ncbi:MAG: toll/interleukin-1 receptor domain-containing protein [Dehalococcoidia bacterium]|nr:toll/interleukin-1 receptor domain-containing protein [Dehalococcoidia bacterium]